MPNRITPILQNVPRGTFLKLTDYVALLEKWQKSLNLVSKSTEELWNRHIADSYQLVSHLSNASQKEVVDLGSGGGLPAIVLAIACPETRFTLVESDRKKAIFLSECIRQLGLSNARVMNERIEKIDTKADIITARALAEVDLLLEFSYPFLTENAYCLFLKGKNWDMEIAKAKKNWQFELETFPSETSEEGRVLKLSQLRRITV